MNSEESRKTSRTSESSCPLELFYSRFLYNYSIYVCMFFYQTSFYLKTGKESDASLNIGTLNASTDLVRSCARPYRSSTTFLPRRPLPQKGRGSTITSHAPIPVLLLEAANVSDIADIEVHVQGQIQVHRCRRRVIDGIKTETEARLSRS